MTPEDFRRIALSLDDVVEASHMGCADFRVGARIFATLAHQHLGLGNLMLDPFRQRLLITQNPDLYFPVAGGWGRMGATHIRLSAARDDQLVEALRVAWNYRRERNNQTKARRKR